MKYQGPELWFKNVVKYGKSMQRLLRYSTGANYARIFYTGKFVTQLTEQKSPW